jgi:hypothetical protein
MESFQPTEVSLVGRILLHPALHVSAIVILVIVAVAYIKVKNREKQSFLAQVGRLQNGPVILDREAPVEPDATSLEPTSSDENLAAQDPNLDMKPSEDQNSRVGFAPTSNSTAASLTQESTASTAAGSSDNGVNLPGSNSEATNSPGSAKNPRASELKVKIIYAEVDNSTLARWAQRMQSTGQYHQSDFRMGMLPNIEKEMASDRSIVTLDKVEKSFENAIQQEWFVGKTIRDQAIGFKTVMSASAPERGDTIRAEVRVTRNFAEDGDPRSFEAEFEAPPQAGWVFADILNRQYRLEPQDEMNPSSIFQIFTFPRFKNLQTQFAMLFIFDKQVSRPVSR